MHKKTFIEYITEAAQKNRDVEEKFKDVDCDSKDLTDEEKDYCAGKKLVKFMYRAQQAN